MVQNFDYNYKLIKNSFINILLKKGKKTNSEKKIKLLLKKIKINEKKNPKEIIKNFAYNASPKIKTIEIPKKKRYKKKKWNKKKNLYLLLFLYKDRQIKIAIKWLFNKKEKNHSKKVNEIIEAAQNKGKIINIKKNYYNNIRKIRFFF